ncbi:hypothetical protein M409DRAFT_24218 [Zasmidium cellare ATCC 36951]|uniref:Zn(2)-C6 fungal-type domain-containing protein n=1 Tax=Zasmidium cellare ATCC 36951 TaxID=1080233 RepID=A0A6A6CGR2_ZASCE|nr:uncharacterized protein M409DRAFT_24218 [Zasmidium cellare ATCC 36951]KAF2165368.1 hypothetical protein M409DRAFT_24218 [Zasmidium cellare ATCC 36951]
MDAALDPKDVFPAPSPLTGNRGLRPEKVQKRSPSDPSELDSSESSTPRKIIDVACWPCRRRKAKCSGERPACAACVRRDVDCSYEHEEGMTRQGSLKLKLDTVTSRAENLEYLFEQLRSRSDNEAALLLAVIRLGADVDQLVERLKAETDLAWLTSFSGQRRLKDSQSQTVGHEGGQSASQVKAWDVKVQLSLRDT